VTLANTDYPSGQERIQGRSSADWSMEKALKGLMMFGVGAVTAGTVRTLGEGEWRLQAGYATVTTNSGGVGTVNFPKPYPATLLAVTFQCNFQVVSYGAGTLTGFKILGAANTVMGIGYIAIGC